MKQKFSTKWKASKQPRKQRKYIANAPLHILHKFLSANLSKDLRKKYNKRNFPLRKNDKVKIMRGEFKNKTGKVSLVDIKKTRVAIEGIQRTKKDGSKVNIRFKPSNLQIQELNLEDKKRLKSIQRTKIKQENLKTDTKQESKVKESREKQAITKLSDNVLKDNDKKNKQGEKNVSKKE